MLILGSDLTYLYLFKVKIETPPAVEWDDSIIKDIISGHYSEFISTSDVKYYYWDELKHRKDIPDGDPIKAWHHLHSCFI